MQFNFGVRIEVTGEIFTSSRSQSLRAAILGRVLLVDGTGEISGPQNETEKLCPRDAQTTLFLGINSQLTIPSFLEFSSDYRLRNKQGYCKRLKIYFPSALFVKLHTSFSLMQEAVKE
jgi:hypothetical protein